MWIKGRVAAGLCGALVLVGITGVPASATPSNPSPSGTLPGTMPTNHNPGAIYGTGADAGATVRIYGQAGCQGGAIATGTGAHFDDASTGVSVTFPSDGTYTISVDELLAGVPSACSSTTVTYTLDTTAYVTGLHWNPASPSRTTSQPFLQGTASDAAGIVHVFTSDHCDPSTDIGRTVIGSSFGGQGIQVIAAANATTTFTAQLTDAAGNTSACSDPIGFTNDTVAPAPPVIHQLAPANDNDPHVYGTAEAGSQVQIWVDGDCSGSGSGFESADTFADSTIDSVSPVGDDTSTTYTAKATDAAGNVSACSDPMTYVEDSTAPATPTLTSVSPATSPSNDAHPTLTGTADAGTTVTYYSDAACTHPLGTGSAGGLSAGEALTLPGDGTYALAVTATDEAGNVSPCSAPLAYTLDTTAPGAPVLTAPASPAHGRTPSITGTADAGSTVTVWSQGGCKGTALATGTAAALASGLSVTVPANARSSLSASAADAAGNVSACSASVTYVEDSTAPPMPSVTLPASPSRGLTIVLTIEAEKGSTVVVHSGTGCTGPVLLTQPAGSVFTLAVPPNAKTVVTATATDAAGNVSACSSPDVYVQDSKAPNTSIGKTATTRRTTASKVKVTLLFKATEVGSHFLCKVDKGAFKACLTHFSVTLKRGRHTIQVEAVDLAGNRDATPAKLTLKVLPKA